MEGIATLKIKKPLNHNIQSLFQEKYSVVHCEYSFNKTMDDEGRINSSVKGGNIKIALPILPNDSIMSWVLDPAKKYNGEITINDAFSESLEKIYFEGGRPVGFRFHYEPGDTTNVMVLLTIHAQRMIIGNAEFTNT